MKMIAPLFLLFLLVSIHTPIGQLLRIPMLIEHFMQHQKQEGVSLFDFLADHYLREHNDADRSEDEQLPFKNTTFNSIGYAVLAPVFQANALMALPVARKIIYPYTYSPQNHAAGIFHPPRWNRHPIFL